MHDVPGARHRWIFASPAGRHITTAPKHRHGDSGSMTVTHPQGQRGLLVGTPRDSELRKPGTLVSNVT